MNGRHGARGAALIAAVLVAAVVAAIAVTLSTRDQFSILGVTRLRDIATVDDLTSLLEVQAARALSEDLEQSRHDGLDEAWHLARFQAAQAAWTAEARLEDAQGRFNLNSLAFQPPGAASGAEDGGDEPPTDDTMGDPAAGAASAQTDGQPQAPVAGQANPGAGSAPVVAGSNGLEACGDSGTCVRSATGAMPGAASPGSAPDSAAAARALARIAGAAVAPVNASQLPGAAAVTRDGVDAGADGEADGRGAGGAETLSPQQVAIARFQLLLEALALPPELLPAVLDWLDADSETRYPNGAEDDYYSRLDPPYRAANGLFAHLSELRLVRGMSDATYAKLAPFVTVIGSASTININTAPAEILMSLGPGIDRGTAEILIGSRAIQPFTSVDMLLRNPVLLGRPLLATGLGISSRYFELRTRVAGDDLPYFRRSLLERTAPTRLRVVRREVLYSDG